MKKLWMIAGAGVLGVALTGAGCSAPAAAPPPVPQLVCGSSTPRPTRVEDSRCQRSEQGYEWFTGQRSDLDRDDFTEVGEELDDDYLEAYRAGRAPFIVAPTTSAARPTTTVRVAPPTTARPTTSRPAPTR